MKKIAVLSLVAACGAHAQVSTSYALNNDSKLEIERCVSPCACALGTVKYNASGGFALTLRQRGPLFDEYAVTGIVLSGTAIFPAGSPVQYAGTGTYSIGGEITVQHRLQFTLTPVAPTNGPTLTFDSGLVARDLNQPFPAIDIVVQGTGTCFNSTLNLHADPGTSVVSCYADQDGSGGLSAADFSAFLAKFRAGDASANCDGSPDGSLSAGDFTCFLQAFRAGCP